MSIYLKNWSADKLESEYDRVTTLLERVNHPSVNDIRYQTAVGHEILRRATLKDRVRMLHRQIPLIKLGANRGF